MLLRAQTIALSTKTTPPASDGQTSGTRALWPWHGLVAWVILVLSSLTACQPSGDASAPNPAALPPPAVTVATVTTRPLVETYRLFGVTRAINETELMARVEGYLLARHFVEGAEVKKGALLFEIDPAPFRAEVARVSAELQKARADRVHTALTRKRMTELRERRLVSQADLDQAIAADDKAAAEIQVKAAQLERAKLDLSYTRITAPFTGRIGRSEYSLGDLIKKDGAPLATLVSLDPIHVYWEASEKIIMAYRRQQPQLIKNGRTTLPTEARIVFEEGNDYPYAGVIDFLDNRINQATSTQRMRAVFPNPQGLLQPNQYVSVMLRVGAPRDTRVIPQTAVQTGPQGHFVYVVDAEHVATPRPVTLGERDGTDWVVIDGVEPGETIVVLGAQKVQPGKPVQPSAAPVSDHTD